MRGWFTEACRARTAKRHRVESEVPSIGMAEDHALERVFELTAQLIAIEQEGGEVYAVIDGATCPLLVGLAEIEI